MTQQPTNTMSNQPIDISKEAEILLDGIIGVDRNVRELELHETTMFLRSFASKRGEGMIESEQSRIHSLLSDIGDFWDFIITEDLEQEARFYIYGDIPESEAVRNEIGIDEFGDPTERFKCEYTCMITSDDLRSRAVHLSGISELNAGEEIK